MNRPPATRRKTYASIPSGGLLNIETLAVGADNAPKTLLMLGVVCGADGDLVAIDSDGAVTETTPVLAGQFWGVRLKSIDETTDCLPITILYSPRGDG